MLLPFSRTHTYSEVIYFVPHDCENTCCRCRLPCTKGLPCISNCSLRGRYVLSHCHRWGQWSLWWLTQPTQGHVSSHWRGQVRPGQADSRAWALWSYYEWPTGSLWAAWWPADASLWGEHRWHFVGGIRDAKCLVTHVQGEPPCPAWPTCSAEKHWVFYSVSPNKPKETSINVKCHKEVRSSWKGPHDNINQSPSSNNNKKPKSLLFYSNINRLIHFHTDGLIRFPNTF